MDIWKRRNFPLLVKSMFLEGVKACQRPPFMHPRLSSLTELEIENVCDAEIEICVCEEREYVFWGT